MTRACRWCSPSPWYYGLNWKQLQFFCITILLFICIIALSYDPSKGQCPLLLNSREIQHLFQTEHTLSRQHARNGSGFPESQWEIRNSTLFLSPQVITQAQSTLSNASAFLTKRTVNWGIHVNLQLKMAQGALSVYALQHSHTTLAFKDWDEDISRKQWDCQSLWTPHGKRSLAKEMPITKGCQCGSERTGTGTSCHFSTKQAYAISVQRWLSPQFLFALPAKKGIKCEGWMWRKTLSSFGNIIIQWIWLWPFFPSFTQRQDS